MVYVLHGRVGVEQWKGAFSQICIFWNWLIDLVVEMNRFRLECMLL